MSLWICGGTVFHGSSESHRSLFTLHPGYRETPSPSNHRAEKLPLTCVCDGGCNLSAVRRQQGERAVLRAVSSGLRHLQCAHALWCTVNSCSSFSVFVVVRMACYKQPSGLSLLWGPVLRPLLPPGKPAIWVNHFECYRDKCIRDFSCFTE